MSGCLHCAQTITQITDYMRTVEEMIQILIESFFPWFTVENMTAACKVVLNLNV
jgi:hypothetical protein